MLFVSPSCRILLVRNWLLVLQIQLTALFFLLLLMLLAVSLRWLAEFNVVFDNLVCENHPFFGPSYPRSLWLNLNNIHFKVFQYFEIKLYWYLWFFDIRNTEVNTSPHWRTKRQDKLWENRAKSILWWERIKLSFVLIIGLDIFLLKFLQGLFWQ